MNKSSESLVESPSTETESNTMLDGKNPESCFGILGHFFKWEEQIPNQVFLRQPQGDSWKEYTWSAAGEKARKITARLQELHVAPGSRIGIWSANCAEWIICDLALMMGGYVSVPLYSNVNGENLKNILLHAECSWLFIGKLLKKDWDNAHAFIPASVHLVTLPGYEKEDIATWQEFIQTNNKVSIVFPNLEDILTIIYTSGTTGIPKGVVHTYGSIINAVEAAGDVVMLKQPGNRFLSYLPLSHAAERGVVDFGAIYSGGTISFVESPDTFAKTLQKVEPTHFFGVPRIWEKFQAKILDEVPQFMLNILLNIPIVSGLIRKKIAKSLGLNKALFILTGAAPVPQRLLLWFKKLGIQIQEAYGLSEDFNVCAINPKEDIRFGTVGKIIPNQDLKIAPGTNEILQRSNWLMKGYYKDPELTAKTIREGYLCTGDTGEIIDGNYLKITGRMKDIFKTNKGEYIYPLETEEYFKSFKEIDQVCMMGSQYPQPFLVVVLSGYGKKQDKEKIKTHLEKALEYCNQNQVGYYVIKKVIIAKEEWTIENNLLTPTLKMKRNAISQRYEASLEKIYFMEESVSLEQ